MSTHNIGFYEDVTKLSFNYQISSNTHLISSGPVPHYVNVSVLKVLTKDQCFFLNYHKFSIKSYVVGVN